MTNIKQFSPHGDVQQDAIQLLEDIIERIRYGEITGVAVATIGKQSQTCGTSWSWGMRDDVFRSLGAINYLQHRFVTEVIEDD